MSYRHKYFQKNIAKKILHKDGDYLTAILVNDITYGIATSDYRDFLYNNDGATGEGFRDAFYGFRKSSIDKSIDLYEQIRVDTDLIFSDREVLKKVKKSIRDRNRQAYWEHKDYLAEHTENVAFLDDNERPVNYIIGERKGLEVHHLKTLKDYVNDEMTLGELLKVSDPKYSVAMTLKGHREGKNIGHAGSNHNSPPIGDPYDPKLPSIPNEYYLVLKEKRDELINFNIDNVSLNVGLISGSLMLGTHALKKKGLLQQITKYKVQKGLFKVTTASFAISSREYSRDFFLESATLQKVLFESRDSLIQGSFLSDSISVSFGDIDIFADSLSYMPFGFVIQAGRFGEDVYTNGFTKQIASKHGKQLLIKTAAFSGGKLILGSFMDPTGASFIIVVSYVGVSYLIQRDKNNQQRIVIEIQRDRTRYYIQKELAGL